MNWLTDGIVDYLVSIYMGFFTGIDGLFELAQTPPSAWHDGVLWNAVTAFNQNAVLPVAYSLLSFFILLELANLFKRSDAKGQDAFYLVMQSILKIGIARLTMDNMDLFIQMIFDLSAHIIQQGNAFIGAGGGTEVPMPDTSAIADTFADQNIIFLLGYFIVGSILNLAQSICTLLCSLIIQLRFIEIYVFTAVCALPFSTLPSQEYSQIFKAYIKRMVALALHVVLICVCLFMFTVLIRTTVFVVNVSNPMAAMLEMFGYTLLLVIALFQTGGWSKSLTQTN